MLPYDLINLIVTKLYLFTIDGFFYTIAYNSQIDAMRKSNNRGLIGVPKDWALRKTNK